MAAITFDALLKVQVREQIRTGSNRFRSMLDAFVSNRMQEVAAEVSHPRPRQTLRSKLTSASRMTTGQFAIPFFSPRRPTGRQQMATETHIFEQPSRSSERRRVRDTHAPIAHSGAIKEFCRCALVAMAAGLLLAQPQGPQDQRPQKQVQKQG